jgi:hypothetical protein
MTRSCPRPRVSPRRRAPRTATRRRDRRANRDGRDAREAWITADRDVASARIARRGDVARGFDRRAIEIASSLISAPTNAT